MVGILLLFCLLALKGKLRWHNEVRFSRYMTSAVMDTVPPVGHKIDSVLVWGLLFVVVPGEVDIAVHGS